MSRRKLSILGSTGSIGTQALEVCREEGHEVIALACGTNTELLAEQILHFRPRLVSALDEEAMKKLEQHLRATALPLREWPELYCGPDGARRVAAADGADMVLAAIVGIAGLEPVVHAIGAGKDIALANKEVLVTGGEWIMEQARRHGVRILPVDSEHSAIWQSTWGQPHAKIRRIWLTASGGPFRNSSTEELRHVTCEAALHHPTWSMGGKISIDSATMMNKGLELIEAMHLFNIAPERIQIVVHPQSIVHSMVEYSDGAVMAQLSHPDMKMPIRLAFAYPDRGDFEAPDFNPFAQGAAALTFEEPDERRFPALRLARLAAKAKRSAAVIMNAANEYAVSAFLSGQCGFLQITECVASILEQHLAEGSFTPDGLEAILELDIAGRQAAEKYLDRI